MTFPVIWYEVSVLSKLANELFANFPSRKASWAAPKRYLKCMLITVFDILCQKGVEFLFCGVLTKYLSCCKLLSVIVLQIPVRPVTRGVPAGDSSFFIVAI